jgi:hypothetical protein
MRVKGVNEHLDELIVETGFHYVSPGVPLQPSGSNAGNLSRDLRINPWIAEGIPFDPVTGGVDLHGVTDLWIGPADTLAVLHRS